MSMNGSQGERILELVMNLVVLVEKSMLKPMTPIKDRLEKERADKLLPNKREGAGSSVQNFLAGFECIAGATCQNKMRHEEKEEKIDDLTEKLFFVSRTRKEKVCVTA